MGKDMLGCSPSREGTLAACGYGRSRALAATGVGWRIISSTKVNASSKSTGRNARLGLADDEQPGGARRRVPLRRRLVLHISRAQETSSSVAIVGPERELGIFGFAILLGAVALSFLEVRA